jgi:spectinomycin phosphotransferase
MKDEPAVITCADITRWLDEHWDLRPTAVTYAAVGGGSYHWIATEGTEPRWFVTANQLDPRGSWLGATAEATRAAIEAAAWSALELAGSGLDFVVAPLPDREGRPIRDILPSWTLLVLPYLPGWSTPDGAWPDPAEQQQLAGLLGRLHAAQPPAALLRWDPAITSRDTLQAALDELDQPWTGGPYSELTRQRLAESRDGVHAMLARYDALVCDLLAANDPWVVTHGEPHSANVVRTDDGRMHLIDGDTIQLAPRERDLAMLPDEALDSVLATYQAHAGPVRIHPERIELFHLWWALSELCGCVEEFRRPHTDTLDSKQSWRNLNESLPRAEAHRTDRQL